MSDEQQTGQTPPPPVPVQNPAAEQQAGTPAPAAEEAAPKQSGTVVVDGVGYAVGLIWQPLQNPDDPDAEVRETMESDPELDLYCLRFSSAPQYGLGKTSLGHREGEPSLAAAVAAALSDQSSVCAVFRLKEGWWFVVIRNDLILSEEDVLYTREEEAQKAFFSMMAVPDWDKKIAPPEWGIEGSQPGNLPELVKGVRKVRLQRMGAAKRTQILLLLAIGILILCGAVIWLVLSLYDKLSAPTKIAAVPTPEVIRPIEPVPEQPKPWEKIVDADAFISRCWSYSYQIKNMTIPGWKLDTITCTPTGLQTGWRPSWPTGSRLTYVKTAVNEYKLTKLDVALDAEGKSAKGSVSWNDLPTYASIPNIDAPQLKLELNDIIQATNLPLTITEETKVEPPNNKDGSAPPNQQVYKSFVFRTTSMYTPWEWRQFFNKFSGLELTKISYNPDVDSQTKWTYEGRIYAK